jgi:hypothetical protein
VILNWYTLLKLVAMTLSLIFDIFSLFTIDLAVNIFLQADIPHCSKKPD